MSTQRRRVLENSKLIIPTDGVYIEGLDGRAYTSSDWKGGTAANSIVVASGDVKFRMALTQSDMQISSANTDPLEEYMTAISYSATAKSDYDGAGNTAKILQMQPSTNYAAGYCNAYIFPDGKTKGYIPSFGQLYLAYKNKAAITAALSACGGTAMMLSYYWSSTFSGVNAGSRGLWILSFQWGYIRGNFLKSSNPVRPFADIS